MAYESTSWADLQPELAAAAKEEKRARAKAWLELPYFIAEVEVVPLTLEKLALLREAGSPFLVGGPVSPGSMAQFLWFVSPSFCFDDKKRDAFIKHVSVISVEDVLLGIYEYLDQAFFDSPQLNKDAASSGDGGGLPVEAFIVHRIAKEYGWKRKEILRAPVACVFQLLGLMKEEGAGYETPLQDVIKDNWLNDQAKRKEN